MKKEIIITGVNGFVGEHLARELKTQGYSVHGVGREDEPGLNVSGLLDQYSTADLLNKASVNALHLSDAIAIIHLAGLASVAESFKHPDLYKTGNEIMTRNILSAAREQGSSGRIVVISTGALYDNSQPMPLKEDSVTSKDSPYSIGKLHAEATAREFRSHGADVVIARPFNHIGPGQGIGFLVPDLFSQLNETRTENNKRILIGNLETRRDYTDVRDIVKAYAKLATATSLKYDTYNISSGVSFSGTEILSWLKTAAGAEDIETVVDPKKFRPSDAPNIVGDSTRIRKELAWEPESNPQKAIVDFVLRADKK